MSILAARMILTSFILRSLKPKNLFVTLLLSNEITHRELQKSRPEHLLWAVLHCRKETTGIVGGSKKLL